MKSAYEFLAAVQPFAFAAVGVIAFLQWRKRGGRAAAWIAVTFVLLAAVAVLGRVIENRPESPVVVWLQKLNVALVVLFPYSLYRFTATFTRTSRIVEAFAFLLTLVASGGIFAFDRLPGLDDPPPDYYEVYVGIVLLQWVLLSGLVAVRLWRGGGGQPGVARRRMRMLSLGAAGLALAIIIAGAAGPSVPGDLLPLVVQIVIYTSVGLFVLGFAPPAFIRSAWRRDEEIAFRNAELGLMEAVDAKAAADALLPYISGLMAGGGAVLLDRGGDVIGSYGLGDLDVAMLARRSDREELQYFEGQPIVSIDLHEGRLVVLASRFAPFFGRDEMEMLRDLARLAELALARADLFQEQMKTRELLSEAQNLAHIGSWEWDLRADTVVWSAEMYKIYGLDPNAFAPSVKSIRERNFPADQAAIDAAVKRSFITGTFDLEHRIRRGNGEIAIIQARGRVEMDNGRPMRMIGTAQDITERKAQEQFRERFISNAAHELRTPVTSIIGFAEILSTRGGALPREEMQEVFAGLHRSGARLATLVNNLLDLSRFQEGRLDLRISNVDVGRVARDVVASLPAPNGKVVKIDVPADLKVRADEDRLDQMLSNLVTNAYRYGGHDIVVRARAEDGSVVLAVEDDGPGVEPDIAPRLFEPFSSGGRSSTVGGSGLGLTIVKMLADASGGDISYTPLEPHGARFEIRLPHTDDSGPPSPP